MRVPNAYLSKREQQIMEALYRHERLTANEVLEKMPKQVHNSTIRTQLRILEKKGLVRHEVISGTFFYAPVHDRSVAAHAALSAIANSFFKGSFAATALALIQDKDAKLSAEEKSALSKALGGS